jgi:hypothetical protein
MHVSIAQHGVHTMRTVAILAYRKGKVANKATHTHRYTCVITFVVDNLTQAIARNEHVECERC